MPLQNRVTPLGDIVAVPERGGFTGNRGIIHGPATRALLARRGAKPALLVCTLDFRGRRRQVMGPGSWTELFFLDEATALAAGHRPCFFCRREAALNFQRRFPWQGAEPPKAGDMDGVLHAERLEGRAKRTHALPDVDLPDGAMALQAGAPHLVWQGLAYPWSHAGYGPPAELSADARLITPPSTVATLAAGYRPQVHASLSPSG